MNNNVPDVIKMHTKVKIFTSQRGEQKKKKRTVKNMFLFKT